VTALILYVAISTLSLSAIIDRRAWALQMETVRMVVSLALRLRYLRWDLQEFTGRELQSWLVYLFTVGSLLWVRFYNSRYSFIFQNVYRQQQQQPGKKAVLDGPDGQSNVDTNDDEDDDDEVSCKSVSKTLHEEKKCFEPKRKYKVS
jgi:hypothetical protein